MKIKVDETFNIHDILECGQAFRYTRIETSTYLVIASGKRLRVVQIEDEVELSCTQTEFETFWQGYFDLEINYKTLQQELVVKESKLEQYITKKPGIRILKQAPFEMMMTFILSQNKSMPQIMQLVNRLAEHYGTRLEDDWGFYYAFPEVEQLSSVSEEDFRALKVGFRAPYLVDAISKVMDKTVDLERLQSLTTEEARTMLLQVKGIGRKVSDCILLFGYHRMDVFPLDVWMKRALTKLYFQEGAKVSDQVMLKKAEETFGHLSGIAQQYIFYGTVEGME